MELNENQKKQMDIQLEAHKHKRYEVDINFDELNLKNFIVLPNVLRPEKMSSYALASWIIKNKNLFKDKVVMDMGCGTGIQGIVAGKVGAKKIIFSDISKEAIENTKENINSNNLGDISKLFESDLFKNINEKADIIIFNHPFFPGEPIENVKVSISMLGGTKLIHKFLKEAKKHLLPNGYLVMPYLHMAGPENDPLVQGVKNNYKVVEKFRKEAPHTLQADVVSIYALYPETL